MLKNLGLALAVGVIANLVHTKPEVSDVELEIPGSVHPAWLRITGLFARLRGVSVQLITTFNENEPLPRATGAVYLLSGGKDTLYALTQAEATQEMTNRHAVYLGGGAELNWTEEIAAVNRRAEHFRLRLHHMKLLQEYVSSSVVLRFANRAVWRELVTLCLARIYGNEIFTGINNDAIAHLQISDPHYSDFLSQLVPTLKALEEILGARVETVPGEFDVYRQIRTHPLFDQRGSCLSSACGKPRLCAKCLTFEIYERILAGEPLRKSDLEYIHSNHFLGDASVLQMYPNLMATA